MAHVYKLKSFDYVGLAEPIRYIFAYGGIPYENVIIKKDTALADVEKTVPFGKLPVLEVDNKILFESVPICWYLSKPLGLTPSDDTFEEAELAAICVNICELGNKVIEWYLEEDKYKKNKWETELEEYVFPKYLTTFEEIVQKKGAYFAGKKISWVDIYFAGTLATVHGIWHKDVLQKQYPLLYQLYRDVHNIPAIKAYVTKYVPNFKY